VIAHAWSTHIRTCSFLFFFLLSFHHQNSRPSLSHALAARFAWRCMCWGCCRRCCHLRPSRRPGVGRVGRLGLGLGRARKKQHILRNEGFFSSKFDSSAGKKQLLIFYPNMLAQLAHSLIVIHTCPLYTVD